MLLHLVHHGEAVDPATDLRRRLSDAGVAQAEGVAAALAARGARPDVVWHSGKLRAKQTAEICWKACNALATLEATRDVQPDDNPMWLRDRLRFEPREVLLAGHFPHLPRLLAALLGGADGDAVAFPLHGAVTLQSDDEGDSWREVWRSA
jgi:phosphohistidine phosphatase